jgi:DNA polymerase
VSAEVDDPRAELLVLTRALRAHVEWLQVSGGTGVPAAERAVAPAPETRAVAPAAAVQRSAPPPVYEPPPSAPPPAAPQPIAPPPVAAAAPLDADARRARLDVLKSEITTCQRCVLHSGRTQTVFARGTGSSGLCFVGEGPGQDEDLQGFPFVGAAGQLLDRMIAAMGILRDDVYVCNIVKCRPPNNRKPLPEEMAACMPYLNEQIDLLEPQVIVALGATAVQGLFGTSEGIMRLRGKWKLYKGRIAVMPTYHPAYLLRTPSAKRDVWEDLQAVLRHMGRPIPPVRR